MCGGKVESVTPNPHPRLCPVANFLVGSRQWGAVVRRPWTCNSVSVVSVEFFVGFFFFVHT